MENNTIKIEEKVEFNFAHIENVKSVAMSLMLAGYFVKVIPRKENLSYILTVYTDRIK